MTNNPSSPEIPRDPPSQPTSRAPKFSVGLLPGLALLAAIGYLGKLMEVGLKTVGKSHHWSLPNIEYVLWAILIGLVVGNLVGNARWYQAIFSAGVATYDFWLKVGIVLLGTRFLLRDLGKLGGVSLALVAVEILVAFGFMVLIGKLFGLGPKLTALLAVGSSICGVSAIIATQGAIDAEKKDTSYAIAAILALGALSLFSYPAIGHALHLSDRAYGVWAGLSVDNTAEAVAAGALYSDAAGKVATLTKATRNATIGFVVLALAIYFATRGGHAVQGSKAAFLWKAFPKFVLGFIAFSALASLPRVFTAEQVTSVGNLSKWAFLLTFAGVGLRTNVFELVQQGVRPFIVGALGEVFIATVTLGMVYGVDRLVPGGL